MAVRLSEELAEFVEGGLSMLVGTRDAALRPKVERGVGAFVLPDRETVTVYLNQALAATTVANLQDNGCMVPAATPTERVSLLAQPKAALSREAFEAIMLTVRRCLNLAEVCDLERRLEQLA